MEAMEEKFTRTDYCGNFRLSDVGKEVSILGWVSKIRKLINGFKVILMNQHIQHHFH